MGLSEEDADLAIKLLNEPNPDGISAWKLVSEETVGDYNIQQWQFPPIPQQSA